MIEQEQDKQLVFIDISARLHYGVKAWYKYNHDNITPKFVTSIRLVDEKIALSSKFNREGDWYPVYEANELLIKPYLRPMSSMTEEEKEKYHELCDSYYGIYFDSIDSIDWLNAHHFDYRGLIPKGLAIEAPKEMYELK